MAEQRVHIYAIYFPTSDKYYVGQTAYLKKRMFRHLNSKSFVGKALRKYDDWTFEVLHTCKTRDEANRTEIEEIRHYNSVEPNGYNLTRGGEGAEGYQHSEEWKQENSKRMQGNQYGIGRNLGNQNAKGIKHTEKWKEENRKRLIGGKRPDQSKFMMGNQFTKGKNLGKRNVSHRIDVKIKRLKNKITKLEQDL